LALDPNNSPSWQVAEPERRPANKMPLFVATHPIYTSKPNSEVTCGCFYSSPCGKSSYLWVATFDGSDSHLSIAQMSQTALRPVTQLIMPETKATCLEFVRATETVWIGTSNGRLLIYTTGESDQPELYNSLLVDGQVVSIKSHCDNVFVGLSTGHLLVYRRHLPLSEPAEDITLGPEPVAALLPINLSLFASCGKNITVLSAITAELQRSFVLGKEHEGGSVAFMAHSGVGLWLALSGSSTVCLYHTETFKHLQDINVGSNVARLRGEPGGPVRVTGLLASKGLLWVGTDSGVALTVPLPRLEGVPIISGRINVSYHGHAGPLTLLLPLSDSPAVLKRPPSKALASDVYGLYGQLMYVKDEEGQSTPSSPHPLGPPSPTAPKEPKREVTLLTVTGGPGYINHHQCCFKKLTSQSHIILWETKL